MSALQPLEKSLVDVYKGAPALPPNGKKALVEYMPYLSLIFGILTLLAAWGLYHAAHYVNNLVDYANTLSAAYGGAKVATNHLSVTVWLAVAALAVEAIFYIAAYPGLKARKKAGWDFLFYGLVFNLAYGIIAVFTDYGGIGRLFGAVLGAAIGGYFLFQIRDAYLGKKAAADKK